MRVETEHEIYFYYSFKVEKLKNETRLGNQIGNIVFLLYNKNYKNIDSSRNPDFEIGQTAEDFKLNKQRLKITLYK